jgi:hypothetical protein
MLKKLLLATAGIALLATSASLVRAESTLDFTLVNKTGYDIKAVHVAPSASTEWGDNILEDTLADGESVSITFQPKAGSIAKWDFLVSWEDESDPDVHWTGYKLAEINKITLKYDRKSNKTSAVVE